MLFALPTLAAVRLAPKDAAAERVPPPAATIPEVLKKHGAAALESAPDERPSNKTPSEFPVKSFSPRRWPVQILSAIYGTAGKNADVTARVKEHVERYQRAFSSNPEHLGADPNPGWNKGLDIIYMKDGVRRHQHRNENETILPESFYGPQDAAELRAWLPDSRWSRADSEIQFHADGTCSTPGMDPQQWEATGAKTLRLTKKDSAAVEFVFDHTWSSFSEVENGRNVYHQAR